jgi:hypothetical protein
MSRNSLLTALALVGTIVAALPTHATAQNRDRKFEVGIRSGLIMGSMKLSGLDPAFGDLDFDGLEGAHMSGYFLLYRVRSHLRIGIETLVANSDQNALTTMNYQAAGPVVGFSYGDSWLISGGLHGGGLIVNAMARQGAAPTQGATAGSFYKGNGGFLAPSIDIGRRFHRHELGVYVKSVSVFGESDRGGLSDFSARFVGVRYALGL